MNLFNLFKPKQRVIKASLNVHEVDLITRVSSFPKDMSLGLPLKKPLPKTHTFSSKFPKPKWYQPWRWHLISEYNKQAEDDKTN